MKSNLYRIGSIIIVFNNVLRSDRRIIRNYQLNCKNCLEILSRWDGRYEKMVIDIADITISYE